MTMERANSSHSEYIPFGTVVEVEMQRGAPAPAPVDGYFLQKWYEANIVPLSETLEKRLQRTIPVPLNITGEEHLAIPASDIQRLVGLLPKGAQHRAQISTIEGKPSLWAKQGTTRDTILFTANIKESISPTAYVLGNSRRSEDDGTSTIILYEIPKEVDPTVSRLMQAATVVNQSLSRMKHYSRVLLLPNNTAIKNYTFLTEVFMPFTQRHGPISKLTAFHRKKGEVYQLPDQLKSLESEFLETLTAYLLGYNQGLFAANITKPFSDRPEMERLCRDYLNAEYVTYEFDKPIPKYIDPKTLRYHYKGHQHNR